MKNIIKSSTKPMLPYTKCLPPEKMSVIFSYAELLDNDDPFVATDLFDAAPQPIETAHLCAQPAQLQPQSEFAVLATFGFTLMSLSREEYLGLSTIARTFVDSVFVFKRRD